MISNKAIKKFLAMPYALEMGAKKISRWWGIDEETIREARKFVRNKIREEKELFNLTKKPNILVFDIETSPMEAYVYQKSVWRANISDDMIMAQWFMLSWSAKFLGNEINMSNVLTPQEALDQDDERITKNIWKVLDEADIVISHNGLHFDTPNLNTRFLAHGLPPVSPYQHIDTLTVARKQFGFTHNSLNAIAKFLNLDPKVETGGFSLWVKCKHGDPEALAHMEFYNKHDVDLLELVYLKLRPWIKGHPNVGLFLEEDHPVCPNCGSDKMHSTHKYYYTTVSKFDTLRCENCGGIARTRVSEYPKELRKNLIVPMYR
jgi:hypothetical protein